MPARHRSLSILAPLLLSFACATTPVNPNAAKYPPQGGSCKIRVFHTPAPEVKEWDDLGVAHVDCPLDLGAVQCLRRLRSEACHMGGDLLYDVPKKPLRPTEEGMVYTGHVAHTKANSADSGKDDEADAGTGASQDEPALDKSGPVEPIAPVLAPPAETGRPKDGGRE